MITDGNKNPKNKFLMEFHLVTRVSDLDGIQDTPCDDFSSVDFIWLITFSSRTVWINNFHNLMKRFSLTKVAIVIGKTDFLSYHSNNCQEKKMLHQKHEFDIYILPLKKLSRVDQY